MLRNEIRKLLLQAWDKTHNAREIAKYFSVNVSTVYRIAERRERTGSYDTREHLRGRKSALSDYTGGTTAEKFLEYLEKVLLPTLNENSVVIMDNMKSHHAKIVTTFLDEKGVIYRYLPPYSPDMNPIEKLWSKVKSILRKLKVREFEKLPAAIAEAFQAIRVSDCEGGVVPFMQIM